VFRLARRALRSHEHRRVGWLISTRPIVSASISKRSYTERFSRSWARALGAMRPFERPFWLIAEPAITPSPGWPCRAPWRSGDGSGTFDWQAIAAWNGFEARPPGVASGLSGGRADLAGHGAPRRCV